MEEMKSKVYIKIDKQNRVLRCEGGYTMGNIDDVAEWVLIDEGNGDKYNLCQSHYFDGGLYTEDGIPRYKWTGIEAVLRTDAELETDRTAREQAAYPAKRVAELKTELSAYDYIGVKIATGVATIEEYAEQIAYCEELRKSIRLLED